MTEAGLNLIARQLTRVLNELASMRADLRVRGANLMRLDSTMTSLLDELRATHAQIQRMDDRIRALELTPDPTDLTVVYVDGHGVAYNAAGVSIGMTDTRGAS